MRGLLMEPTSGDWPEWRQLVFAELENLSQRVKTLETERSDSRVEMAILKTKMAGWIVIATILATAFVSWIGSKIGVAL